MLNAEKYRDEIQKLLDRGYDATLNKKTKKIVACKETNCNNCAFFTNKSCVYEREKWLISEYKEPILTEAEKEYLRAVIKPFRKKVKHIVKINLCSSPEEQFIKIVIGNLDFINFPNFNKNTGMYKGMEADKLYSLEELGL